MSRSTSDRTVSTANSGTPWAWRVTFDRAAVRHAGHQRVHQLIHRGLVERVQGQRDPVAPGPEPRPSLLQLGPGEDQHVDGQVLGPVDQVIQEVQQPAVGVLGVLDQQHHRRFRGEALEEQPPPREQFLPGEGGRALR